MDPSRESTSHQEQFFELLKDDNTRKIYNKTLDLGKKYVKKLSNINFMSRCIEAKIVPNTFKITNQPYGRKNPKFHEKWTSAAKTASLSWMKITLKEEQNLASTFFDNYKDSIRQFGLFVPRFLLEFAADTFKSKNDNFQLALESDKNKKFEHLQVRVCDGLKSQKSNKNPRKFIKKSVWTRRQRKFRNKGVCLYFNYSNIKITKAMDNLLNRGLNFSPTPGKVNITELLVDIDKFIRTHLWKEYFFDNQPIGSKPPIVKNAKTNLPKKP